MEVTIAAILSTLIIAGMLALRFDLKKVKVVSLLLTLAVLAVYVQFQGGTQSLKTKQAMTFVNKLMACIHKQDTEACVTERQSSLYQKNSTQELQTMKSWGKQKAVTKVVFGSVEEVGDKGFAVLREVNYPECDLSKERFELIQTEGTELKLLRVRAICSQKTEPTNTSD